MTGRYAPNYSTRFPDMSIPSTRRGDMSIFWLEINTNSVRVDCFDTKQHAHSARRLVHVHRSILTWDKGESLAEDGFTRFAKQLPSLPISLGEGWGEGISTAVKRVIL
jgi:hypothetical protein